MTQVEFATDLTEWFAEGIFIAALVFSFIYAIFFNWRETVTGRATLTLSLCIAGTLFHMVLLIWGADTVHITREGQPTIFGFWDEVLTWFSICCLAGVALAFITLTWQCLQYIRVKGH